MKKIIISVLVLLALAERLVFDLGPNIELITTASIIAGMYFGFKDAVIITLFIAIVSDLVLGNNKIFIFTWSGFLLPLLLIKVFSLFNKSELNSYFKVGIGSGIGVISNVLFYLWTNFGVWFLDSWGMYTKDFHGLILCYINGLPFMRYQVLSNLFIVPMSLVVIEILYKIKKVWYNELCLNGKKAYYCLLYYLTS
jgi:hypothetical protein